MTPASRIRSGSRVTPPDPEPTRDAVHTDVSPPELARFIARENRFVCHLRRADGEVVRAHLPNTARLEDLLVAGVEVVLQPSHDPRRRTAWTLTRVRHAGTWVALEAGTAADLMADLLGDGGALPGWPAAVAVQREVRSGPHRIDLGVDLADGTRALVEVKSLSRAVDGRAPLSWTPSTRGVAQLTHLLERVEAGTPTAVAFVVQRGDVAALDLAQPAEPSWVTAVRAARRAGVHITAFRCSVTPTTLALDSPIPVLDGPDPAALASPYATTIVELESPGHPPVTVVPDPDGHGPGSLPDLVPPGTRHLHIVTACNPRSRRLDDATNAARNRRFLAEIQAAGLPVLRADGGAPDGSWHEPGFALLDIEVEVALDLARRHDQHAIFELTPDHLTVRWTDPQQAPIVQGWHLDPG